MKKDLKRLRWNASSLECYRVSCECSEDCFNYHICKKIAQEPGNKGVPPMKRSVELLIENGVELPRESSAENYCDLLSNTEKQVLKVLFFETDDVLKASEILGFKKVRLNNILSRLYHRFMGCFEAEPRKCYEPFMAWARANILPDMV